MKQKSFQRDVFFYRYRDMCVLDIPTILESLVQYRLK